MRKICVVVASRANYGRVKYLMKALKSNKSVELQIIVGASMLLDRFGKAVDVLKADGFKPNRSLYYIIEGENLNTQAKSTGFGIIELSTAFEELQPDLVVTVADRFETMATAIASTYMNIPLAHIQGGEISGNIDERVRHSITKLADIHFPSTEHSRDRLIKMGENPKYIFNFGCPAMDILENEDMSINNEMMDLGLGTGNIDWTKPYILLSQHPVTTSYGEGRFQIEQSLYALKELEDYQKVVLWPNIDAGSDDVAKGIRLFRESNMDLNFQYVINFSPEIYAKVLANASCLVGNSSSFIREASYLGVPAVIIGNRQRGRECGENVVFSDYNKDEIKLKIEEQISKKTKKDTIFGEGKAGELIGNILATVDLDSIDKRNMY